MKEYAKMTAVSALAVMMLSCSLTVCASADTNTDDIPELIKVADNLYEVTYNTDLTGIIRIISLFPDFPALEFRTDSIAEEITIGTMQIQTFVLHILL